MTHRIGQYSPGAYSPQNVQNGPTGDSRHNGARTTSPDNFGPQPMPRRGPQGVAPRQPPTDAMKLAHAALWGPRPAPQQARPQGPTPYPMDDQRPVRNGYQQNVPQHGAPLPSYGRPQQRPAYGQSPRPQVQAHQPQPPQQQTPAAEPQSSQKKTGFWHSLKSHIPGTTAHFQRFMQKEQAVPESARMRREEDRKQTSNFRVDHHSF